MFFEGGDKYLLPLLNLLKVVITVGCAGEPEKNGKIAITCDEKRTLV